MQIVTSFSTVRAGVKHDTACLITAGEHPFFTADSYARYEFSYILGAAIIERRINANEYLRRQPDFSETLFAKVCAGFAASADVALKHQKYFAANSHL